MRWKEVRLEEVCEINPKRSLIDDQLSVTFLSMADVSENGKILNKQERKYEEVKKGFTAFSEDDILVAKITPCFENGKGARVFDLHNGIGFGSTEFHVIRPKSSAFSDYIYYSTRTSKFREGGKKCMTGSAGQQRVPASYIRTFKVPLPDLPTQQHIAAVLDKAEALRQQNQQLLTYYDELLKGIFIELFGDPVTNEKGWEVKKLGEVVQFLTSGSRGWAEYYSDSGSKFLRIQNVGYNKLKLDEIAYVVAPDTAEAKRTRVQADDILLSITADLGRTAVIPENFGEAYISQHLALLRLEGGINSTYISELLASEYCQRQFASANKGGVKAGLNFNDIKSVNLLFPPISLQNHFTEIAEKIEVQKEQTRVALAESEALFEGLLAGYFGENQIEKKGSNPGPPTSQLRLF